MATIIGIERRHHKDLIASRRWPRYHLADVVRH
jgi:hypothetical protein